LEGERDPKPGSHRSATAPAPAASGATFKPRCSQSGIGTSRSGNRKNPRETMVMIASPTMVSAV
jgi:hypothetical protein